MKSPKEGWEPLTVRGTVPSATMASHTNAFGQPVGPDLPGWRAPQFPSRTPMQGNFCRLEPVDPTRHGAQLRQALSLDTDGRDWTYLPYGPFATEADYQAWLARFGTDTDPQMFAIVSAARGTVDGLAGYLRIFPEHGSIEIGHLVFSRLIQRTATATEALVLLIRRAFELGYRRVEWKCDSFNHPSRAAALRLGFSFEGLFRQAIVYKGRSRDTVWFSIIDTEWPGLSAAYEQWLAPANFDAAGQQRTSLSSLTQPLLRPRVLLIP